MRIILALLFIGILTTSCNESTEQENRPEETLNINSPYTADGGIDSAVVEKMAHLVFTDSVHDFGLMNSGEVVVWDVEFQNDGKGDAIIQNASASCGCTVPEYDRQPIKPGEKGSMQIKFDSEGKKGIVEKRVTVETNAFPATYYLTIKADIK